MRKKSELPQRSCRRVACPLGCYASGRADWEAVKLLALRGVGKAGGLAAGGKIAAAMVIIITIIMLPMLAYPSSLLSKRYPCEQQELRDEQRSDKTGLQVAVPKQNGLEFIEGSALARHRP